MLLEGVDAVPTHRPDLTATGKPTLRAWSKTDRNNFYFQSLASNVLAAVLETFAVAPSIQRAEIVVVRPATGWDASSSLEIIYRGNFNRESVQSHDWKRTSPLTALTETDLSRYKRGGRTQEVLAIDLSDEPETVAFVDTVAHQLLESLDDPRS